MNLLAQYLRKVGVERYDDLNSEEKATFRQWEQALEGRRLTDEDVRGFLDRELEESIQTLISKNLNEREDTFLKMKVDFIRRLTGFLDSPKAEKKALEQLIQQQL